jgi:hypothetical protein
MDTFAQLTIPVPDGLGDLLPQVFNRGEVGQGVIAQVLQRCGVL